ncbi:MAG: CRISPR system precrRNA processing endoribonuclease RAMP protein Cas6 [Desulfuromonadaceae bacterium]|nr:CRISPR system precrRNA processing endoribonuclease RAMP protein Cas6 [Desulfuromonadaceae bacterium]
MDLNLVHIVFEVTTYDPVSLLPHMYVALRRFDGYFKSASCFHDDFQCNLCKEQADSCPYRSVFDQLLSTDPVVLRRHQKPPLPYAFKISEISDTGSSIELCLSIAGNAMQHLSIFRDSIKLMISSVASNSIVDASVTGTWCLDYQGSRHEFNTASHSLVLLSAQDIIKAAPNSDALRIYLESPLRLLCGGTIAHFFDFRALLRSQLRRCSSFFAYYGEGELELDYVHISEAAERVVPIGNGFSFKKPDWSERASLAGMLGVGEFRELTDGMQAVLKLGSYLNAGKGAAYGMGVYRIEELF